MKAIYEKFYGLSGAPFDLTPDPGFLYLAPSHYEAFSAMLNGIRERKGITVVTGPPGIGKTTLAYALLKGINENLRSSFVYFTRIDFEQLLRKILLDFGITTTDTDLYGHMQKFFLYLNERLAHDETVAIVIDEAQGLKPDVLNDLLRLCTRPQPSSKILQLVLIGQPEFEETLNSEELADLRDKTAVRRRIKPLNREESKNYLDHRLKVVGSSRDKIFRPEAVSFICEFGSGIPRLMNMVCDAALTIGYHDSAREIDGKMVKKAASELTHLTSVSVKESRVTPPAPKLKKSKHGIRSMRPWYAVLGFAILAGISLIFFNPWQTGHTPQPRVSVEKAPVQEKKQLEKEVQVPASKEELNEQPQQHSEPTKVIVQKGHTLSSIALIQYQMVNPTILDLILEANPGLEDLDRLEVNKEIRVPTISEEAFLLREPNGEYKIHIETVELKNAANLKRYALILRGKTVEIVPQRVAPRKIWYRIEAGSFATKEDALDGIRVLNKRGLMPGLINSAR